MRIAARAATTAVRDERATTTSSKPLQAEASGYTQQPHAHRPLIGGDEGARVEEPRDDEALEHALELLLLQATRDGALLVVAAAGAGNPRTAILEFGSLMLEEYL